MRPGRKIIIIVAGLILLAAHFVFLFSYAFSSGKLSFFYVYPYFNQNWNLFVPAPANNYNLYVYGDNFRTTDLFSELLVEHQSNRLKGAEPLLIALTSSIHYFEKEEHPDVSGPNFKIIEKFTKNYLEQTRNIKISKLHLLLVVNREVPGKVKIYSN